MYPDFEKELVSCKDCNLTRELIKPKRPSILGSIVAGLFTIVAIVWLVRDCVDAKEWYQILLDVILIITWLGADGIWIISFFNYKRIKHFYDWLSENDKVTMANPAVRISEYLTCHSLSRYHKVYYGAAENYAVIKGGKPKKYARILKTLEQDTEICKETCRILFKDPEVLKATAKMDTEHNRFEDKLMLKYKALLDMNPEERVAIEAKYDQAAKVRNYARENYGKKK